jgi:hypothetical protein
MFISLALLFWSKRFGNLGFQASALLHHCMYQRVSNVVEPTDDALDSGKRSNVILTLLPEPVSHEAVVRK